MDTRREDILNRPVQFLLKPQLVVHTKPTRDDLEAEKLVREALTAYYPNTQLEVIKWGQQEIDWVIPGSLPALRTVGSLLHGLAEIRAVVQIEDEQRASLRSYQANVA